MMTLTDVQATYTVNRHGTVTDPGKFEQEPAYVVALWELMLNGYDDEVIYDNDMPVSVMLVDGYIQAEWPELADVYAVLLWEDSVGFAQHHCVTERELADYRAECEENSELLRDVDLPQV